MKASASPDKLGLNAKRDKPTHEPRPAYGLASRLFRLGPITFTKETIPAEELEAKSKAVLSKEGALKPTPSLMNIEGDLIVALSDGDFVSFAGPFLRMEGVSWESGEVIFPPLTLPNVARNLIAHELGHGSDSGITTTRAILCAVRRSVCRPDSFRSNVSTPSL